MPSLGRKVGRTDPCSKSVRCHPRAWIGGYAPSPMFGSGTRGSHPARRDNGSLELRDAGSTSVTIPAVTVRQPATGPPLPLASTHLSPSDPCGERSPEYPQARSWKHGSCQQGL